jgi:hypothetical protein
MIAKAVRLVAALLCVCAFSWAAPAWLRLNGSKQSQSVTVQPKRTATVQL